MPMQHTCDKLTSDVSAAFEISLLSPTNHSSAGSSRSLEEDSV